MSEERTITIARALKELKLTESKIIKAISEFEPTCVKIGKKLNTNMTEEEFVSRAKSNLQSIKALLSLRSELKAKIIQSNAVTKLKVAGKEMTVAQAIEQKSSIALWKQLTNRIREHSHLNIGMINKNNRNMEERSDESAKSILSKEVKKGSTEYEDFIKTFKDNNESSLIDPLDWVSLSKAFSDETDNFEADVDISLTESNSVTMITVAN